MATVPCNARRVLRLDPRTDKVTEIGPEEGWDGRHKWYGGIYCPNNGAMYCIPQSYDGVLKVCTKTGKCNIIGERVVSEASAGWLPIGAAEASASTATPSPTRKTKNAEGRVRPGWKWHGGMLDPSGHLIFGIPSNADQILRIDTRTDEVSLIGPKLRSGRHRDPDDGRYKYLGCAAASDGNIYVS